MAEGSGTAKVGTDGQEQDKRLVGLDKATLRPKRNAHQALDVSLQNINSEYQDVVDIDLKSFFDEVDHELLLNILYRKIKCSETLCLILRFMRAPIKINGRLIKRRK